MEEERVAVVKLLEEENKKKKQEQERLFQQQYGSSAPSLVVSDFAKGYNDSGKSNLGPSSGSMLLDVPQRPPNNRARSSSNIRNGGGSLFDNALRPQKSAPSSHDPNLSNDGSFYYKSSTLRSQLPSSRSRETSRSRAEEKKPSFFKFWRSNSNSRNNSTQNLHSRTSSNDGIDREKLLLSQNMQSLGLHPSVSASSAVPPSPSRRPPIHARSQSYSSMLDPDYSSLSPQHSRTPSVSREDFKQSYRLLTDAQLKKVDPSYDFGDKTKPSSNTGEPNSRRLVDEEGSSSDDDTSDESSDEEESDSESPNEESIDDNSTSNSIAKTSSTNAETSASQRPATSMLDPSPQHAEAEESPRVVRSMLDVEVPGAVPAPSMAEYAAYKRRIIHPNTAFNNNAPEDAPYTSTTEEFMDAKRAAQLPFEISTVHSNLSSKRMIRTMTRGENIPSLTDPDAKRPKTFVLGTDLSPESAHALEWTIGTVLRDTNVLYVVCAFEDEIANGTSSVTPQQQEDDRMGAMTELTQLISKLVKQTRLQIHVIIEVIHCKSPRHLLTAVIDYVNPTMVVLGSRGRSAIKGVLLGSFSNYIVERSSVPVMVARRKLHKTKHKDLNVRLANNLRAHGAGLERAIVD